MLSSPSKNEIPLLNVRDELQHLSPEEILNEYQNNCNKDVVMCINIQGEFNIGTVVRTASLFGMEGVIIIGKRSYDQRTTVGMHNYINVEKILCMKGYHNDELDINSLIEKLINYSKIYKIVFIEQGGVDLKNFKYLLRYNDLPIMFVLGTENNGIPKEILEKKDILNATVVSINQRGVGRSFNVGVAFGIVAFEYYND